MNPLAPPDGPGPEAGEKVEIIEETLNDDHRPIVLDEAMGLVDAVKPATCPSQ